MKLRTPGQFGHTFANSGNPDETAPYFFLFQYLKYETN